MSVTGNKMRTDCSPCRRRFRYRRIRWDTWEQDRADAFESVLISSPRKWGLRVAHNALSLRQADRADSEDHVAIDKPLVIVRRWLAEARGWFAPIRGRPRALVA